MLIIREAQMRVFREKQIQDFENGRISDLAHRFPKKYSELEESGTSALVKAGISKAFGLGIVGEEDVEGLIDLMMLHGQDFDTREEFAYETQPLRDEDLPADARVPLTLARFGLKPGFFEDVEDASEE
jgi:hypothetical protein